MKPTTRTIAEYTRENKYGFADISKLINAGELDAAEERLKTIAPKGSLEEGLLAAYFARVYIDKLELEKAKEHIESALFIFRNFAHYDNPRVDYFYRCICEVTGAK